MIISFRDTNTEKLIPKNRPSHPGKFVQEDILTELSITQTQLANALGYPIIRSIN